MRSYQRVEKLNKTDRHYVGYGRNNLNYHVMRTTHGWQAECVDPNVPADQFAHSAKRLMDIDKWLGKLPCQK